MNEPVSAVGEGSATVLEDSGGRLMKWPALVRASSSFSTCARSSKSAPHASSKYAARSEGSGMSNAFPNIDLSSSISMQFTQDASQQIKRHFGWEAARH